MPEFHLTVDGPVGDVGFYQLDAFTQGYIEALFFTDEAPGVTTEEWQATEDHDEGSIPGDCGFSDLAPDTLASIQLDCAKFQADHAALLAEAYARDYDAAQAGRDLWFTRNGHGVGYWDREELKDNGAEYERLTNVMVSASQSRGDNDAWDKACSAREALNESSIGNRLSTAAKSFGSVDSYLGDDDLVYLA